MDIGSVAIMAIVRKERPRATELQAEDIVALAHLMLALGCAGGPRSLDALANRFSPDFTHIVHAALPQRDGGAGAITSWQQACALRCNCLNA